MIKGETLLNNYPWAYNFSNYLDQQATGLRKQAFKYLEKFIEDIAKQPKEIKRSFIASIIQTARLSEDFSLYLPYNFYNKVIKSEILEWINEEPENPNPYGLSSDFSDLRIAVKLDPSKQDVLKLFYTQLINKIRLNQHEVEFGFRYSGNPNDDIILIEEAESYLKYVEDYDFKAKAEEDLRELKKVILSYVR